MILIGSVINLYSYSKRMMGFRLARIKQKIIDILTYIRYFLSLSDTPGSIIKRIIINKILKEEKIGYFIETGTYLGDTVQCVYRLHKGIYIKSIELSTQLYSYCKRRFAKFKRIEIINGDSSVELLHIFAGHIPRALIFLDGHYSGGFTAQGDMDCPLLAELDAIDNNTVKNHVIIIDDVRLFGLDKDYPSLLEVMHRIKKINVNYKINIKHDMLIAIV